MKNNLTRVPIWFAVVVLSFVGIPSILFAAEVFPSKPVTVLVGFSPGGGGDLPIRALATFAPQFFGQPMIVVNKPGASGILALNELRTAKPDGYTIGYMPTAAAMHTPGVHIPFDPRQDFTPIIQHFDKTYGLVVLNDSPFRTLSDLVAFARANPNKVTYGTAGPGTPQHLVMLQLGEKAGVRWKHIPYKGGAEAVTALLGGHVTACSQTSTWAPYVDSGKLRLLAVYQEKRIEYYPQVPTLAEQGFHVAAYNLDAIVGPNPDNS